MAKMRFPCLLVALLPLSVAAQNDSRLYVDAQGNTGLAVSLAEAFDGSVNGTLVVDGARHPITARYQGDRIIGSVRLERYDLYFEAVYAFGGLQVTLMDLDRTGQPRPATAQQFHLEAEAGAPSGPETRTPPDDTRFPTRRPPMYSGVPGAGPLGVPYVLDPMLGRFSDGFVHLDLFGANGRYEGTLSISGRSYPVRLIRNAGGEFEGGYWVDGIEEPLVVALTSNGVSATLNGYLRVLPRVADRSPYAGFTPGGPGRIPPGAHGGLLPYPGQMPFNEAYLTDWFHGKAVYFPDPLARSNTYGIVSRRVLHLCSGGELEVQDGDVTRSQRAPTTTPRRGTRELDWKRGTWQLYWDDIIVELEIRVEGRVERFELTFGDQDIRANDEPVLIGYSDRCR